MFQFPQLVAQLGGAFVVFDLPATADFVEVFEITGTGTVTFGNKRSLSIVAVVGVQVDVDCTAARIESVEACKEAIMIQNTIYSVMEDYTLSKICHNKSHVQGSNNVQLTINDLEASQKTN